LKISIRLRRAALSLALAVFAAGPIAPLFAQSMPGATPPAPAQAKSAAIEALRLPADAAATPIVLAAPDAAAVEGVKKANAGPELKRLQIGFNRDVGPIENASSAALTWAPVDGGFAAKWSVTSTDAKALRVGLSIQRSTPSLQIRFAGSGRPGTVYGPISEAELNTAAGATYWSPVLEGDTATVELFVASDASPKSVAINVAQVSHLIVNPAQPQAEQDVKATGIGSAGFCEVNLICRSASDAGLAATGTAVARMTFSDSTGTFLCTGTVLNSTSPSVPYFYTAAHCISDQSTASTLSTWWFYDSTTCNGNTLNPNNQQVGGGATLLYANTDFDISFMRLNSSPPSGVTFSGWDASTLASGVAMSGVHHPAGDLTKVSLATFGGYVTNPPGLSHPNGSFIMSNWNSVSTGVTEGGSSGSGIFTQSNGQYLLHGGLLGGPSSCTASGSSLNDYYSRFDVAYQNISQYLSAAAPTNYTALWWNPSESGWGVNVAQQGDIVFATLFTYDTNGTPMWLVLSNGARQGTGDTFSGTLYRTTGTPFSQNPFTGAQVSQVGTMTFSFSSANAGTLSYSVNGTSVSKTITKQLFGPNGAATCTSTTGSRANASNYTDLWWNPSESGWGINLTQQSNLMFATLFVYGPNSQVVWYVMSAGTLQSDGSFTGTLYQASENGGGNFATTPWPGVLVNQVGSMTLRFSNGETGTLSYTVNGTTVQKSIIRQVFSTPVPLCS
jgi:hypothetical protein